MSTYRFVIAVDVCAQDLNEAYAKLNQAMSSSDLEWESTDEAYGVNGEELSEDELSNARIAYMEKT